MSSGFSSGCGTWPPHVRLPGAHQSSAALPSSSFACNLDRRACAAFNHRKALKDKRTKERKNLQGVAFHPQAEGQKSSIATRTRILGL